MPFIIGDKGGGIRTCPVQSLVSQVNQQSADSEAILLLKDNLLATEEYTDFRFCSSTCMRRTRKETRGHHYTQHTTCRRRNTKWIQIEYK